MWFAHIAERAMDTATRKDWERERGIGINTPSYVDLMDFFSRRVRLLAATEATKDRSEKSEKLHYDHSKHYQKPQENSFNKNKARTVSSKVMLTHNGTQCRICAGDHHASRCLGKGHDAQRCPSNGVCRSYQGRHHTLLHAEKRQSTEAGGVLAKVARNNSLQDFEGSNGDSS